MSHPPYSLDVAPSDYHLFLALLNFFKGKRMNNKDEVKKKVLKPDRRRFE